VPAAGGGSGRSAASAALYGGLHHPQAAAGDYSFGPEGTFRALSVAITCVMGGRHAMPIALKALAAHAESTPQTAS